MRELLNMIAEKHMTIAMLRAPKTMSRDLRGDPYPAAHLALSISTMPSTDPKSTIRMA
jgi:hypothetical protein